MSQIFLPVIHKVISGAQTGADLGGLDAAKELELATGGTTPLNFTNETGQNPGYGKKYNLHALEHSAELSLSDQYRLRTEKNVKDSDGTVIFVYNSLSGGSLLTFNKCLQLQRPCSVIDVGPNCPSLQYAKKILIKFILMHQIETLNVAGNRESKSPGIYNKVREVVSDVIKSYRALYSITDDESKGNKGSDSNSKADVEGNTKASQ